MRIVRPGDAARDAPASSFVHEDIGEVSMLEVLTTRGLSCHAVCEQYASIERLAVLENAPAPDGPREGLRTPSIRVAAILAQSDVISFLGDAAQAGQLGNLSRKTVSECGWVQGPGSVVTVSLDLPTVAALAVMHNAGVAAAAVVKTSADGEPILTVLSMSDVRHMSSVLSFSRLAMPVYAFLAATYGEPVPLEPQTHSTSKRCWLVSCTPEATYEDVLRLLIRHAVHRVFIVDAGMRPVGVVSMTDALQLIARFA